MFVQTKDSGSWLQWSSARSQHTVCGHGERFEEFFWQMKHVRCHNGPSVDLRPKMHWEMIDSRRKPTNLIWILLESTHITQQITVICQYKNSWLLFFFQHGHFFCFGPQNLTMKQLEDLETSYADDILTSMGRSRSRIISSLHGEASQAEPGANHCGWLNK